MSLLKFESMLKTNQIYFFDLSEFEEIIIHYLDVGKHHLAKKALKLGLEQHPESIDLKLLQVELHIFNQQLENAEQLLQNIETLDPHNVEVFIQRGTLLSKRGNHKKAIENFHIALNLTDDKQDIWSLLGMEYLYEDDYTNAQLYFAKCIEEDDEDFTALYNIVYCYDMQKNHEEAIEFLHTYIEKNPYCEIAWHQIGRQYFVLEKYEKALTAFDYAVLIDESFVGGYLEKAKTFEQLKRYQEAIDNYLVTIELEDPTAYAYIRIGVCSEKLNKKDAAIRYYQKAVHEDPLLDKGWVLLANLYFERKNYQKALYYITKSLFIDEDNALYWRKFAEINLKLSLFEEAVNAFEKCLKLNDQSLEIYIGLSDVLLFLGEFEEALTIISSAKRTYLKSAEVDYRLAALNFILNNPKVGIQQLISALKIDFEYHTILKELHPGIFDIQEVNNLILNFRKATE